MSVKATKTAGLISLNLLMFLILVAVPAHAAKIYKWVDKDGNVQFSNTPGPDQDASSHIGEAKLESRKFSSQKKSLKSVLEGLWFGTLRGQSYRLRFSGNSMSWGKASEFAGSVYPIFDAVWKDVDGDLLITYTKHAQKRAMGGKTGTIRIISKSDEALTLQFPDKRVYNMVRSVSYRRVGIEGKKILGSWIRKNDGAEIKFKSGTFNVIDEMINTTGRVTIERGNWNISNGVIAFTYTSGRKTSGRQGTKEEFDVLLIDENQLILADKKSRKQIVYNKKLVK